MPSLLRIFGKCSVFAHFHPPEESGHFRNLGRGLVTTLAGLDQIEVNLHV